ncbi:MAG: hypothetical protein AAFX00_11890 [Pseudomonadota bacterium]
MNDEHWVSASATTAEQIGSRWLDGVKATVESGEGQPDLRALRRAVSRRIKEDRAD